MPGKPRFNLPGVPQHVIQPGNNREPFFYSLQDYLHYLDDIRFAAKKYECRIHAYVLMTNHVQLLVTPMIENGISMMMQSIGRRYVAYMNTAYKRTGTLWEGRYKASLIDSEMYLLTCMCYIELNPVRAGIVDHPGKYKWSSYKQNAQVTDQGIVDCHPVFTMLGDTNEERKFVYRSLFERYMDNDIIHQFRDALNHEMILGRSHFKDKVEVLTNRITHPGKLRRPRVKEERAEYYVLV